MESTSWVTYADGAAYTIHFTTYQYIPKDGILTVEMPAGVEIAASPVAGFSTSATGLAYSSYQSGKLLLKAAQ